MYKVKTVRRGDHVTTFRDIAATSPPQGDRELYVISCWYKQLVNQTKEACYFISYTGVTALENGDHSHAKLG